MIEGFVYERPTSAEGGIVTYVIHATCRYVLKNTETGEEAAAECRPTIRMEAKSEKAAIQLAEIEQMERVSTPLWAINAFRMTPELITVVGSK